MSDTNGAKPNCSFVLFCLVLHDMYMIFIQYLHGLHHFQSFEVIISRVFSPSRPTGWVWSSSRDVRPLFVCCLLSPSHAILPGEQRSSYGSKAVSQHGISTLKKIYNKKCKLLRLAISPVFGVFFFQLFCFLPFLTVLSCFPPFFQFFLQI